METTLLYLAGGRYLHLNIIMQKKVRTLGTHLRISEGSGKLRLGRRIHVEGTYLLG